MIVGEDHPEARREVAGLIGAGEPISWAVLAPRTERLLAVFPWAIGVAILAVVVLGIFGIGRIGSELPFGLWDVFALYVGLPFTIGFLRALNDWLRGGHEYYAITTRRLLIARPKRGRLKSFTPAALNSIYVVQSIMGGVTDVHFRQEDRVVGGYDRVIKMKLHGVKDTGHAAALLRALHASTSEVSKEGPKPV